MPSPQRKRGARLFPPFLFPPLQHEGGAGGIVLARVAAIKYFAGLGGSEGAKSRPLPFSAKPPTRAGAPPPNCPARHRTTPSSAPKRGPAQLVGTSKRFSNCIRSSTAGTRWAIRHDQDFLLFEDVHVVFHFGGESVRAHAQSPAQSQRVIGHAHVGIHHPAVHHGGQLAVDLATRTYSSCTRWV